MEFLFYLFLFWITCGVITFIYAVFFDPHNTTGEGGTDAFLGSLIGGPFFLIMAIREHGESKRWQENYEKAEKERKEKAAATRKKKKQEAQKNLPNDLKEINKIILSIESGEETLSGEFFNSIEKICGYCSTLTKKSVDDLELLLTVLKFARKSVGDFYKKDSEKPVEGGNPKIATASGVVGASSKRKSSKPKPSKSDKLLKTINSQIKKYS